MAGIRALDMRLIDSLFDMGSGYVLDFNDRSFAAFFRDELQINIDDPRFSVEGTSKAKRLRYFLRTAEDRTAARTLLAMWEYRTALHRFSGRKDANPALEEGFDDLIERLGGKRPKPASKPVAPEVTVQQADPAVLKALAVEFVTISGKPLQERGYAFERWLKSMFDSYGLKARHSFRLQGEQIDGSCELSNETYLLEARWRNAKTDGADLHSFHGKLEQKAAWSRGLYISMAGFTDEGLQSFGKGKRLICMEGLDLHMMLDRGLPFDEVLRRKVRRAAETGSPFCRVRDLF